MLWPTLVFEMMRIANVIVQSMPCEILRTGMVVFVLENIVCWNRVILPVLLISVTLLNRHCL